MPNSDHDRQAQAHKKKVRPEMHVGDKKPDVFTGEDPEACAIKKMPEIKKDNLFKAMFRSFRHYYHILFQRFAADLKLRNVNNVKAQVQAFLTELNIPCKLISTQNICLVMLMLHNSFTMQEYSTNALGLTKPQLSYFNDNRVFFDKIFNDNNANNRKCFFANPLCYALWTKFIEDDPQAIVTCVRYLKSD